MDFIDANSRVHRHGDFNIIDFVTRLCDSQVDVLLNLHCTEEKNHTLGKLLNSPQHFPYKWNWAADKVRCGNSSTCGMSRVIISVSDYLVVG